MINHSGYELVQKKFIAEINSTVSFIRHIKTGAEILSIENDDENKVFGVTFRTPPQDSSGLPHIMEHSVLCGSRKYPVKEPFVELIKGSLNTFLNAFTYPDKTCYPVASTNLKDFYNLIDVYLDAVFYPILSPYTLMQEGWHYELNDPNDEMIYKGVVFNEMKGAFSSPDDILGDESQMALFPDTPYGLQSGGDPDIIPTLTYHQFKSYHDTYYHPSNSRFFFYGDDDPQKRLSILDEYLNAFDHKELESNIPLQKKFDQPWKKIIPYDSGEAGGDAKAYILVNWLLPEGTDQQLTLGLSILAHILLATPASPLKKALTESGLGEDVIGGGLDVETQQMSFSTGLRGVSVENLEIVQRFILDQLKEISENGIDPKTIEASINTIEFSLRENNTGSFPRGLLVMLRSLSNWIYDRDPLQPLAFQLPLSSIKQRIENQEPYFENLIKTFLIENTHRVTIELVPDDQLGKLRAENERLKILNARSQMTFADIEKIIADSKELKRRQETPDSAQALATIPRLSLADLDPNITHIPNEIINNPVSTTLFHDLFTSDILYLDLGINLHTLSTEELPYLRLFSRSLLEMGTTKEDFVSLIQRIGRETGGIHHTIFTSDQNHHSQPIAYLFLRSKAMVHQTDELLSILEDILSFANFADKERFRQMVLEEKSSMEAGLIPSGHRVVNNRLKSHLSTASWITEQISGLDYLDFIRNLIAQIDQDWEGIQRTFAGIREKLLQSKNLLINFTIDEKYKQQIIPTLQSFSQNFMVASSPIQNWIGNAESRNEGLTIPSQINFVAKGANLYDIGYRYHGSMNVITAYLQSTWLWDKVRVQGGAYGSFATFDRFSGIFTFLSYRDPNLDNTLEIYDQTANFLKHLEIPEEELTKSIIGAIGDVDSYQLPDAKGFSAMIRYLLNISAEERQQIRDEIIHTSIADFRALADHLEKISQQGSVVVLGSAAAIEKANRKTPGFLKIKKVM